MAQIWVLQTVIADSDEPTAFEPLHELSNVPVFDAPEHMSVPVHGSWEALFQARPG